MPAPPGGETVSHETALLVAVQAASDVTVTIVLPPLAVTDHVSGDTASCEATFSCDMVIVLDNDPDVTVTAAVLVAPVLFGAAVSVRLPLASPPAGEQLSQSALFWAVHPELDVTETFVDPPVAGAFHDAGDTMRLGPFGDLTVSV